MEPATSGDWAWAFAIVGGAILLAAAYLIGTLMNLRRRRRLAEQQGRDIGSAGAGDRRAKPRS